MKQENIDFLEANRHHYDTIVKAGYVKHLNAHEREGMVRVMNEEFQPGYTADLWCPPCVFDMVKLLYQRYDAWMASQPKVIENIHATFPVQDKPQENEQDIIRISDEQSNTSNSNHSFKRHFRRRK